MAGFFLNREGNISVFRIGILIAIVGGVIIVGGLILAGAEQAAFRSPLDIAVPPETQQIAEEILSPVSRRLYYDSIQTPEQLARYYDERLAELQGIDVTDANRDRCIREPRDGNYPNYVPGSGTIPYQYQCLFQEVSISSGLDKSTTVIIHPGVRNDATGENLEGVTRIYYEQYWQP